MAFIPKAEMEKLREDIKKHYGIDITERITRVEFVGQSGQCTYLHTEDQYKPVQQPTEKVEYCLCINDGGDIRQLPFKSRDRLKVAFDSFKRLEQYQLTATLNGTVLWEYSPK